MMVQNKREVHLLQSWQHVKESLIGKLKRMLKDLLFTYQKMGQNIQSNCVLGKSKTSTLHSKIRFKLL